ncbi:immunoglobulin-like domain-containing protein [Lactiplantibacillus plantarum]|nr:immunoglobulin-like domain-containing protein [Lactiplantibacillus plantarum]MBS0938068.1 hypothetical protein [Lactiplantibacillus plantarum]MBS0946013.1 hypothetical protein [Lactiplantibacillus plantarum]
MNEQDTKNMLKIALSQISGIENVEDEQVDSLIKKLDIPENINKEDLESYLWEKVKNIYDPKVNNELSNTESVKDFGSIVVDENFKHSELLKIIARALKAIGDKSFELNSVNGITEGFNDPKEGYSKIFFTYSSNVLEDKKGTITVYTKCTAPYLNATTRTLIGAPDINNIDLFDNVTAVDAIDGDIRQNIEITFNGINIQKEGTYPIVYYVKNSRGIGSRLCVWDTVVSEAPRLIANDISVPAGKSVDREVIQKFIVAEDAIDGDITNKVILNDQQLDLSKQGVYQAKIEVTNSNNKMSETTVKIVVTAKAPQIIVTDMHFTAGIKLIKNKILENVKAVDSVDGDITKNVEFDVSTVDTSLSGNYVVKFRVKNSNGLETITEGNIEIIPELPTIKANDFVVKVNSEVNWLAFADVEARDLVDGDLTSFVTCFNSDVKLNEPGEYSAYYMVRNSNNEQATAKVTVHVI